MRNPFLCIVIVCILGVGALLGTCGVIWMAMYDKTTPQVLVGIVSGCYGALASFLVQPPRGSVGSGSDSKPPPSIEDRIRASV